MMTNAKQCVYLALLVSMCFFLISCDDKSTKAVALPVSMLQITKTPITFKKEYVGFAKSVASVDIVARVDGFLDGMYFAEGRPAKKGELLFQIDKKPYEANLLSAEGQVLKAKGNLEYQKVHYLRMKNLVAKGDISKEQYDQAHAKYLEAQGNLKSAIGDREQARINLGYTSMYAPFDGLIGYRRVDVGNMVGGKYTTTLASIIQLNPIYVFFSPATSDYVDIIKYKENMPFPIEATLPLHKEVVFKGKVDSIDNKVDLPTSTLAMRALLENNDFLLRPGVYLNVTLFLTDKLPAILVPKVAVIEIQGQRGVFVVDKDSKAAIRFIDFSEEYEDSYIVEKGLREGETVILSNLQKLKPGMLVRKVDQQTSSKDAAVKNG